jgi:hypothetical protein
MYQCQFTNNPTCRIGRHITFKVLAAKPLYMLEPNPTEQALIVIYPIVPIEIDNLEHR